MHRTRTGSASLSSWSIYKLYAARCGGSVLVCHIHTHTHPFHGPATQSQITRTTRVSRYQKGYTSLDFTEARDSEWQWHQLGHMQVCISLRTDNHASTPPLKFFTGRMPFLPPNQQRQSTKKIVCHITVTKALCIALLGLGMQEKLKQSSTFPETTLSTSVIQKSLLNVCQQI